MMVICIGYNFVDIALLPDGKLAERSLPSFGEYVKLLFASLSPHRVIIQGESIFKLSY